MFKEVTVREPGYAYVFVSNEHPTYVDVYFDDITVTHTPSPIISSSDYFAFGLQHSSGERAGVYEQRTLYNSKELQDELNIGWLDYGARMYDPSISRWSVIDPMADERSWVSPYNFVQNNPLLRIDPDGRLDIINIVKGSGKITITKAAGDDVVRLVDNGTVKDQYKYGSNGSFKSENNVQQSDKGTTITTASSDKADAFYKFAAGSDVEFGKLDVQSPTGESVSAPPLPVFFTGNFVG